MAHEAWCRTCDRAGRAGHAPLPREGMEARPLWTSRGAAAGGWDASRVEVDAHLELQCSNGGGSGGGGGESGQLSDSAAIRELLRISLAAPDASAATSKRLNGAYDPANSAPSARLRPR